MDVNEWMSYESSDEGTHTQNIHYLATRSHPSEEENRNENFKCKGSFTLIAKPNHKLAASDCI
jgi:hypothetical protein